MSDGGGKRFYGNFSPRFIEFNSAGGPIPFAAANNNSPVYYVVQLLAARVEESGFILIVWLINYQSLKRTSLF